MVSRWFGNSKMKWKQTVLWVWPRRPPLCRCGVTLLLSHLWVEGDGTKKHCVTKCTRVCARTHARACVCVCEQGKKTIAALLRWEIRIISSHLDDNSKHCLGIPSASNEKTIIKYALFFFIKSWGFFYFVGAYGAIKPQHSVAFARKEEKKVFEWFSVVWNISKAIHPSERMCPQWVFCAAWVYGWYNKMRGPTLRRSH